MNGVMGASKFTFGGKTWPAFYFATQVAINSAITGGSIQTWMQMKDWDSLHETADSYYNLVTEFTFTSATAIPSITYTQSCGTKDLVNG